MSTEIQNKISVSGRSETDRATVTEGTDCLRAGQILSAEEGSDETLHRPATPLSRLALSFRDHRNFGFFLSSLIIRDTKGGETTSRSEEYCVSKDIRRTAA